MCQREGVSSKGLISKALATAPSGHCGQTAKLLQASLVELTNIVD